HERDVRNSASRGATSAEHLLVCGPAEDDAITAAGSPGVVADCEVSVLRRLARIEVGVLGGVEVIVRRRAGCHREVGAADGRNVGIISGGLDAEDEVGAILRIVVEGYRDAGDSAVVAGAGEEGDALRVALHHDAVNGLKDGCFVDPTVVSRGELKFTSAEG